jgi:predicted esterase
MRHSRSFFAHLTQLAIVLSCLLFGNALAQDAGLVLRTSVGYRTVKNTAQMDEATKQQVIELEKKANEANSAQKYGEAMKHLSHGIALMRKQPWTPLDAFKAALTVKAERLIFDPGDTVSVKLGQMYALDEPVADPIKVTMELKRTREGKAETVKELKVLADSAADFTKGMMLEGALPTNLGDGTYQLVVAFTAKTGDAIVRPTTIRIQRDLLAQSKLLSQRIADLQKTNGRSVDPRGLVIGSSSQNSFFSLLSARADYTARMIDLINANELPLDRYNLSEEIAAAHEMLDSLTTGKSPLLNKRGDIHWAYQSAVDKTPQPYRLFVPSKYEPNKAYPLIVALHGMGGNENSFFDSYAKGALKDEAEKRGYVIVCPKGRGPADMYLGNAQKDVLDAMTHVRQLYNIDPDRIYLMGHSMGGYGTWITAVNQPELFAALAPISGGAIPPVTMGLKKIAHVPALVVHGNNDPTVNVEESRKVVKALQELGAKVVYKEVPGGDHSNVVVPAFKEIYDFFDANKRAQPKPQAKAAGSGQTN